MSYIVLRGRWCNIIVCVHAPSEEKSDDSKDSFFKNKSGGKSRIFIIFLSTIRKFF